MGKRPKPPGIYIEHFPGLPSAVRTVETAIPAFIGYTEKAEKAGNSLLLKPIRISSMAGYRALFGGESQITDIAVVVDENSNFKVEEIKISNSEHYLLYDSLKLFFDNEGKECFIVSVGFYGTAPAYGDEADPTNIGLRNGVKAIETYDAPTLILFPDAVNVVNDGSDDPGFYSLQQMSLQQCGNLQDRFCILDIKENIKADHKQAMQNFRNHIGSSNLKFGAAYSPFLINSYSYEPPLSSFENNICNSAAEPVLLQELSTTSAEAALIGDYLNAADEASKKTAQERIYREHPAISAIVEEIGRKVCTVPPSGGIAGIYAQVDLARGVWKAPANVSINSVSSPNVNISREMQVPMNVDPFGKSINAIRFFAGRGILVWGARTLAGNDNEWKYIPVMRLVIMLRESCAESLEQFRNKPNTAETWLKIKRITENFLTELWRKGACTGTTSREAFFVKVGLGETMTNQDLLDGRVILEMGLAVVRPAEFTIIRIVRQLS